MTTGSYQYIDGNGLLQTVNYISDPVHGFRVAGTNLPVGPAVPAAAPLASLTLCIRARGVAWSAQSHLGQFA